VPSNATKFAEVPHSWTIETWPPDVYPGNPARARYLTREHREALMAEGVLTRVGRELVIFGARYCRWLEKLSHRVPDFDCAANLGRPSNIARAAPVSNTPPQATPAPRKRGRPRKYSAGAR
jgi:hypothetical protein